MAKKTSARSKGFRTYQKEPVHLTKEQWTKIGIAAAALVLVIVLIIIFYDDGSLKVKDGNVVTTGDNWLVVNTTDSTTKPKYYKVGEVTPAEGFAIDPEKGVSYVTDKNEFMYTFTPEDAENCDLDFYYVVGINQKYDVVAEQAKERIGSYMADAVMSDTVHEEIGGTDLYYYYYTTAVTESDETTEAEDDVVITGYTEYLIAYMGTKRDDCAVMFSLAQNIPTLEEACGQEVMRDYLAGAVAGVTVTEK